VLAPAPTPAFAPSPPTPASTPAPASAPTPAPTPPTPALAPASAPTPCAYSGSARVEVSAVVNATVLSFIVLTFRTFPSCRPIKRPASKGISTRAKISMPLLIRSVQTAKSSVFRG
ncbi:unnamed protein product, partial [Chrysoparadoxa australica]